MKFPLFNIFKKASAAKRPYPTGRAMRSAKVQPRDAKIIRDVGGKIMRMFDGALTDNLSADFPISLTSANAEIITSMIALRSRSRKMERDNSYGASIVRSFMRDVGGPEPFRLESKVGTFDANGKFKADKVANRKILNWWAELGKPENCTVRRNISRQELYLQATAALPRCGGVLWRHHRAFDNFTNYAIEPLEVDRLDQNYQRPKVGNNNEIQFGIEMDEFKAPLFYHILTRHPGDIFAYAYSAKYRERVPAADVIALWDIRTRPEQMIGIPRMSSVLRLMHRIEQFDIAHVTAAMFACCKPFWIEKTFPGAQDFVPDRIREELEAEVSGEDGEEAAYGQREVVMQPGEVNELEYGQKVTQHDPKFPVESAKDFKKDQLRAICTGVGRWYPDISQDLESVNFASGRLGLNDSREDAKIIQEHMILNGVFPHFAVALKYALMGGALDLPYSRYKDFLSGAIFHGRRWPYNNPLQDVQADLLAVEGGLDSRSNRIRNSDRGGDVEEVDAEIQSDRETDAAHDLNFVAEDVTKPTISKGEPGETRPAPQSQPAGKNSGDSSQKTESKDSKKSANRSEHWAMIVRGGVNADHGCLMAMVGDNPIGGEILKFSNSKILPDNIDVEHGLEDEPHITVLYGFDPEFDANRLGAFLEGLQNLEATTGAIKRFECPDFDVLVVGVDSPSMVNMNRRLNTAFARDIFASNYAYNPHMTLGYVKKGAHKELDGDRTFAGRKLTFGSLLYSLPKRQGRQTFEFDTKRAQRGVRRMHYARLEQTLKILNETDEEFRASGEYSEFLKFKAARNGSLTHKP